MPVHDAAPFLAEAIESVLRQDASDLELVAIDDGSHDESPALLEDFARRDPRVRVRLREGRGLVATRNELLELARGEFVTWLDADDVAPPGRVGAQAARLRAEPELVCVGGFVRMIDPQGAPIGYDRYPRDDAGIRSVLARGGGIRFGATSMRRAAVEAVGAFRSPFSLGEDLDLIVRLAEIGRLANLGEVMLDYRQHPHSTSQTLSCTWQAYRDAIFALADERRATGSDALQRGEKLDIDVPDGGGQAEAPPVTAMELHVRWARSALAHHFFGSARKHALQAVRHAPSNPTAWRTLARALLGRPPRESDE